MPCISGLAYAGPNLCHGLQHNYWIALYTQFNGASRIELRQAEQLDLWEAAHDVLHEIEQLTLSGIELQNGSLKDGLLMIQVLVMVVKYPLRLGPGHLRKPRHEVMMPQAETGHTVDRIGNQAGVRGKVRHEDTLGISALAVLRLDLGHGTRMPLNFNAGSCSCTLPCVIVRRGTDAAKREDDVVTCHRGSESMGHACWIIAQILAP